MRTVWIDPDRDDHAELVGALEGVGFTVIGDVEDGAHVLIWTNCAEVGDWSTRMPDEPVAAAWYLNGWLDHDDCDSYYDDEDDES